MFAWYGFVIDTPFFALLNYFLFIYQPVHHS